VGLVFNRQIAQFLSRRAPARRLHAGARRAALATKSGSAAEQPVTAER